MSHSLLIRSIDHINRVLICLAGIMMAVASCAVMLQIAVRFFSPKLGIAITITWTDELARFLITWSVFLGLAVLSRRGGLIAITALIDSVPARISLALQCISALFTALFFGILAVKGFDWALDSINETSTVMRIPMAVVYAAMPVGAVIAIVNLLLYMAEVFMVQGSQEYMAEQQSTEA